jgi:ABC-type transport system involved in multi-copper enzyme maturation permease subunit
LILQGEASSSSTPKDKTSPHAKRKIKLRRVFEREFSNNSIDSEFYIISKPIYKREILVEKVILILIVIVNLILVTMVNLILVVKVKLILKGKEINKTNLVLISKGNKVLILIRK